MVDKHKEYRLGVRAGALLKDDLFAEVMKRLREQLTEEWRTSTPTEEEKRADAYHGQRALDRIEGELRRMENDARVIEKKEQHRG